MKNDCKSELCCSRHAQICPRWYQHDTRYNSSASNDLNQMALWMVPGWTSVTLLTLLLTSVLQWLRTIYLMYHRAVCLFSIFMTTRPIRYIYIGELGSFLEAVMDGYGLSKTSLWRCVHSVTNIILHHATEYIGYVYFSPGTKWWRYIMLWMHF